MAFENHFQAAGGDAVKGVEGQHPTLGKRTKAIVDDGTVRGFHDVKAVSNASERQLAIRAAAELGSRPKG